MLLLSRTERRPQHQGLPKEQAAPATRRHEGHRLVGCGVRVPPTPAQLSDSSSESSTTDAAVMESAALQLYLSAQSPLNRTLLHLAEPDEKEVAPPDHQIYACALEPLIDLNAKFLAEQ